jgi:hypothetical protein
LGQKAILDFQKQLPLEEYVRLTYTMIVADVGGPKPVESFPDVARPAAMAVK